MKAEKEIDYGKMCVTNALYDNSKTPEERIQKIADTLYNLRGNENFPDLLELIDPEEDATSAKRYRQNLSEKQLRILSEGVNRGIKKIQANRLEKTVLSIITVAGFLGSFIFLSPNLTGNTILAINKITSNIYGVILFIIGIASTFILLNLLRK